jgi:hypothetical protein
MIHNKRIGMHVRVLICGVLKPNQAALTFHVLAGTHAVQECDGPNQWAECRLEHKHRSGSPLL